MLSMYSVNRNAILRLRLCFEEASTVSSSRSSSRSGSESGCGISHRDGGHSGDGAEVSLLVDENFADEGGIDDQVAVRMVVSHCFAADCIFIHRLHRLVSCRFGSIIAFRHLFDF